MKILKPITWKNVVPYSPPNELKCLECGERGNRKDATHIVVVNGKYNFPVCEECTKLSTRELLSRHALKR